MTCFKSRCQSVYQAGELLWCRVSLAKTRLMNWQELVEMTVERFEDQFFKAL